MSVELKNNIDGNLLQKAVELALDKYEVYKVKMKKKFWSYRLIRNELKPIVKKESSFQFKKIHTSSNNKYLFRVTYLNNKINLEVFHALTDGNSATQFLKEIVYRYLGLKHPNKLKLPKLENSEIVITSENAYAKNYKKKAKKKYKAGRAHVLNGPEYTGGDIGVNLYHISLPAIRECTAFQKCTLSMYISAMIAYSIYEGDYRINNGRRPVNLCLPINLQKYFETDTVSNFFSYMVLKLRFKSNRTYTFDNILNMVKREYKRKYQLERIVETMSTDAGLNNNFFIKLTPLFLKKLAVMIGSLEMKKHFTMTISNIGKIEFDEKYENYIENTSVTLSPDWAEKMKCGVCSYKDTLVVSFGTYLKDNKIEKRFRELLEKNGIGFRLEKNVAMC